MLTGGRGNSLVPPKRRGKEGPVIFGPGNKLIESGFPRQMIGAVSCEADHIERLVRTEKSIRAGFIIVTSDKNVRGLIGRTMRSQELNVIHQGINFQLFEQVEYLFLPSLLSFHAVAALLFRNSVAVLLASLVGF